MCADQAYSFEKTINEDMDRVWRHLREKLSGRGAGTLPSQLVGEKCAAWIEKFVFYLKKKCFFGDFQQIFYGKFTFFYSICRNSGKKFINQFIRFLNYNFWGTFYQK